MPPGILGTIGDIPPGIPCIGCCIPIGAPIWGIPMGEAIF